ncbi:MAG: Rpn family recombination-promoting nuclease/putative transposase [Lachnospiraceae bacterium]|nr:Rpn family recombination-promoting nuclease/putative transposase [Lachnospiraceae bacterium]
MKKESYKSLRFTNDFMFCKILSNNPDLCKELIEMILDVKINRIMSVDPQEPIEITPDGRGIRLDVRVEDEKHSMYCVEMQTTNRGNIPKRSRYYQAIADLNSLERSEEFDQLNKSYIIFVCLFDLFHKGYRKYVFRSLCVDDPSLELGDDTEKVFLNAKGNLGDVSEKMRDFLNYISTGKAEGELSARLEEEVVMARKNPAWEMEYASYYAKLHDEKEAGIAEGRILGHRDMIQKLIDRGKSVDEIAELFDMAVKDVTKLIEDE